MAQLVKAFGRYQRILSSVSGMPLKQKIRVIGTELVRKPIAASAGIRRRAQTAHVSTLYKLIGPKLANRFFWNSPTTSKTWYDIETRGEWVNRNYPKALDNFVACGFEKTTDAIALIGLARSPVLSAPTKTYLNATTEIPHPNLVPRLRNSQVLSAAYISALLLLDGPDAARKAWGYLDNGDKKQRKVFDAFLSSIFFNHHDRKNKIALATGFQSRKRRRLLILETARSVHDYQHLLRGADDVTVIDIADLYGKTDLSTFDKPDVGNITTEHVRSRITRFSSDYHKLHDDTKTAAVELLDSVKKRFGAYTEQLETTFGQIALDLADQIFFEALRVRAVSKLLDDESFDHIVIAGHVSNKHSPFYRTLLCVGGLRDDPRVEFTSTSRSMADRLKAKACFEEIIHNKANPTNIEKRDFNPIFDDLKQKAGALVSNFPIPVADEKTRLLYLVNHNPAYDPSSAVFLKTLAQDYNVTGLFLGNGLRKFLETGEKAHDAIDNILPVTLSYNFLPDLSKLSGWLQMEFLSEAQKLDDGDIKAVILARIGTIIRGSVLPSIATQVIFSDWVDRLEKLDLLPSLVLVCPQRSAKLGVLAEVSREKDIPSIALEPHGLNGNYCRYSKVSTDYYAVISSYFHDTVEDDFGLPKERCRVIGSPRIVVPPNYNPIEAKIEARQVLTQDYKISFASGTFASFFCQPSNWAHVEKVWENILIATAKQNITLLLKPHPEESPSRIAKYMDVARRFGDENRVHLVSCKPDQAIAASDFVLTGYSAAAIDAAILMTPVFCVTAEHQPYPVDQHSIVQATLSNTAAELRDRITHFTSDPSSALAASVAFLENEPQFVQGPNQYLLDFVKDVLETPINDAIRKKEDIPRTYFLDGPFEEFSV